jgi:DNA-nicking Smr family endonuclease
MPGLLDSPIAATLDLHGLDAARARQAVERLLRGKGGARPGEVVHIVTGRGRGSAGRPVLKPLVRRLLSGDLSQYIREYSQDLNEGGYIARLR